MTRGDGHPAEVTPPMPATGSELKMVMDRERRGGNFVLLRDDSDGLRLTDLDGQGKVVSVGRDGSSGIPLTWDREVSRLHARLSRVGDSWVVEDDGLSRNGTFVNGERLAGSARLHDRDLLRFGGVAVLYRSVTDGSLSETLTSAGARPPEISAAERRVLDALARPWVEGHGVAAPATNGEIAEQLVLSVHTVKSHLQTLFAKFGLEDIPQSRKRAALIEAAYRAGALGRR